MYSDKDQWVKLEVQLLGLILDIWNSFGNWEAAFCDKGHHHVI